MALTPVRKAMACLLASSLFLLFCTGMSACGAEEDSHPYENRPVWTFAAGERGAFHSSPAVADGLVYIGSFDGSLSALNLSTGGVVWRFTTGRDLRSPPTVAGGVVFVGSYDNSVYALNGSDGRLLWSYETDHYVHSMPVVADGMVFVGSYDRTVYALGEETGTPIWTKATGSQVRSLAVANGLVYVGSADGEVLALDQWTGDDVWSFATGDRVDSHPTVAEGMVLFGCAGKIYAFDGPTGVVVWSYEMEGWATSTPQVAGDLVFVGSGGRAYALQLSTGALVWEMSMGGSYSYPTADGDMVFLVAFYREGEEGPNQVSGTRVCAWDLTFDEMVWSYDCQPSYWMPVVADGVVIAGLSTKTIGAFPVKQGHYVYRGCTGGGIGAAEVEPAAVYAVQGEEGPYELVVTVESVGYEGNISYRLIPEWSQSGRLNVSTKLVDRWGRPYGDLGFVQAGGRLEARVPFYVRGAVDVEGNPYTLTEPMITTFTLEVFPTICEEQGYSSSDLFRASKRSGEFTVGMLPMGHEDVYRGCIGPVGPIELGPKNLTLEAGEAGELAITLHSEGFGGRVSYEGNMTLNWVELEWPEAMKVALRWDYSHNLLGFLEAGGVTEGKIPIKIYPNEDEQGKPYPLPVTVRCRAWVMPEACNEVDDWQVRDRATRCSNWITLTVLPAKGMTEVVQTVWHREYTTVWERVIGVAGAEDGGCLVAKMVRQPHDAQEGLCIMEIDGSGYKVWEKDVDLTEDYHPYSVQFIQAGDGGFAVAGQYSDDTGSGIYVLKLNQNASKVWEGRYTASGWQDIHQIIPDVDGGFALAGFSEMWDEVDESYHRSAFLLKIDGSGRKLWRRDYPREGEWSQFAGIAPSGDGGFLVGILEYHEEQQESEVWRVDPLGDIMWRKAYEPNACSIGGIVGTGDGGVVLSCQGEGDYLTKLDARGNTVWVKHNTSGYVVEGGDVGFLLWSEDWPVGSGELIGYDRDGNEIWRGDHGATHLARSGDGGYVGAMEVDGDVYVVKIDADGGKLWDRIYGDYVSASSLVRAADGGFFLVGYTYTLEASRVICLTKLDSEGNTIWERRYGGQGWNYASFAIETQDGGILVAGRMTYPDQSTDICLMRFDEKGDLLWEKHYGDDRQARYLVGTLDGGCLVVGYFDGDVYLLRLDSSGTPLWEKTHGYRDRDYAYCAEQTSDGGFLVVGQTRDEDGSTDGYLLRIGGSGDLVWQGTFGDEDYFTTNCVTSDENGFLVAGISYQPEGSWPYVLMIDESGDQIWRELYGNLSAADWEMAWYQISRILQHHEQGFVVAGGIGSWEQSPYLLRINTTGETIWEIRLEEGDGPIESIISTPDGWVVAGEHGGWGEPRGAYLMKLREVVSEGLLRSPQLRCSLCVALACFICRMERND